MICAVCQSGVPYPPCRSSYCEGYQDAKNETKEPCATCWAAGLEAGRLAAIRAEVERALEDLADDVEMKARESRGFMRETLRHMKGHRRVILRGSYTSKAGYELGRGIGLWTRWERARRRVVGRLDQTRRWLEATR